MKVGVITTSRADYSIYFPLLKKMNADLDIELTVFALGMHLSTKFGMTVDRIVEDGFNVVRAEDSLVYGDSSFGVSCSTGLTLKYMASLIGRFPQDLFFCLGDRFEMFGAVSAVIPFGVPIAHLHGGEVTEGAIDEKYRHAISKLADIHFTSCEKHKRRVIQMGANPQNVFNVGALGVENINTIKRLNKMEILEKFNIDLNRRTILGTYQSVTAMPEKSHYFIDEFCSALDSLDYQFVLTLGNADTKGDIFIERIKELGKRSPGKYRVFENLGVEGYLSVMDYSEIVIGNSSSGIIEAASLNTPVVNIGDRQKGRECSSNVIHCSEDRGSILEAISKAEGLVGMNFTNIYEKKGTAQIIVEKIKTIDCKISNKFFDLKIKERNEK